MTQKRIQSKEEQRVVWNLTHLFLSDTDPRMIQERERYISEYTVFAEKWRKDKTFLKDPKVLRKALDEYEELARNYDGISKAGMYWILRSVQDQTNEEVKAKKTETIDEATTVANKVLFFSLELAKVSPEKQREFLTAPELQEYKHLLEQLFAAAKYQLSEAEESILLKKEQSANDRWVDMVSEFLSKEGRTLTDASGKKASKGFDELMSITFMDVPKKVRDEAAKHVHAIQRKLAPLATHELNAILYNKKIDDELRKIPRPDLDRFIADDIEGEIVDALVAAVTERFDISARFYRFRASLFGQKQLAYHERMIPFGNIDKTYTYQEAEKLVSDVFHDVDREFGALFDSFVAQGLIDAFPKKGKSDGAACYGGPALPSYQYMNFVGKLRDLTTLAHESGHAIHHEMSKKQKALLQNISKATAEVASTFMEGFALDKILGNVDEATKLALLVSQLDAHIGAIHRQVALYNFETELHASFRRKLNLSQKEIGQLFQKHMSSYMGDAVKMDKGSENWWVYWTHIRLFFYVYSYASGHLISTSMRHMVKEDKTFINKVKGFLSAGQSKSTRDIFMDMGIDIANPEFWKEGLAEIEAQLNEAEKLAKKLGVVS